MTASDELNQLRKDIAADAGTLREASDRLGNVLGAASSFPEALRVYRSGSTATRFTNDPVDDADGGVVMDRRAYRSLGPDGDGELPAPQVEDLRKWIRPTLKEIYPDVSVRLMKRGLLIECNEPLASGEDPSVDLVLALNRAEDNALWIPDLDRNRWDPGHPERHVELFTAGGDSLRATRRHVVRVAKAQVKQFVEPAVCSFNIAVLAWECFEAGEDIAAALHRFFDYAARELSIHQTKDPAGVSPAIKVPNRNVAVKRFRKVADSIELAIDAGDDDEKVQEILCDFGVFWKLIDPPAGTSANSIANGIATGRSLAIGTSGLLTTTPSGASTSLKSTRSYGS